MKWWKVPPTRSSEGALCDAFVIQMHFMSCLKGGLWDVDGFPSAMVDILPIIRAGWLDHPARVLYRPLWVLAHSTAALARCTVSAHSIEHIDMHRFHLGCCCLVSPRRLLYCWLLLLLAEFSLKLWQAGLNADFFIQGSFFLFLPY